MPDLIDTILEQLSIYNNTNPTPATEIRVGEEAYRTLLRYNPPFQAQGEERKLCGCKLVIDENVDSLSINIC